MRSRGCSVCRNSPGLVQMINVYTMPRERGDLPVKTIPWKLKKQYEINAHPDFTGEETALACLCKEGQKYTNMQSVNDKMFRVIKIEKEKEATTDAKRRVDSETVKHEETNNRQIRINRFLTEL